MPDGSRPPVWLAFDESRPLAFFAGLGARWTSVRKVKEGETTNHLFGFPPTEPRAEMQVIHPAAKPVRPTRILFAANSRLRRGSPGHWPPCAAIWFGALIIDVFPLWGTPL